ncbi:unnamed protein product [Sphagnum balticum]
MGRCRCSFCNIRVSRVARACGFKDECTTQSMFSTVARFRFLTHTCILTSNNVIKFVLFLFCALSSLSCCCCLESTNAPAPAPATSTGPPPLPVPLSDLPAGLNATLINGFWYYYETKEVDAMQSLFEAWSNTAANSFSYNLPGWSNQVGFNYPCFESGHWQGVACLQEQLPYNGTTPIFFVAVHYLELSSLGLEGVLPPAIGNLSQLEALILVGNPNLGGPIPQELGNTNLAYLDLHDNAFNGSIPVTLGLLQDLTILDLSGNDLSGPIPPQLGNASQLETLLLNNNNLTGTIPVSSTNIYNVGVDNLTSLMTLNLQENLLSGGLPNLQRAYQLLTLNCSFNNLSGNVLIDSIFNLTISLGTLDLSFNAFTGAFPNLNNFSKSLQYLDLSSNLFYPAALPRSWLSNFTHLETLGLSNISSQILTNIFPNAIIDLGLIMEWLPSLQILRLDQNNITASLDLASINITGPLHVVNLIGNNIGPNITLYYNMSRLVSNGISIMLEDNPCCVNAGLNDVELYYFCNIINHPPSPVNDHVIEIIMPITIVIFLVGVIGFFLYWSAQKDKYTLILQIQQEFAKQDVKPTIYAYNDIKIATRDFHLDMKIGQGSFGVVYKGVLQDRSEIAVKQLLTNSQQGIDEFLNEVVLITNVRHKNLVKLKGCCLMGGGADKRLLVYEFIDNNNLAETIFENKGGHNVDWPMRKNICLGVARGLNYLHEDVQPHIIHRDIKASNILLDKNFNAKIADFGLARLFPNTNSHISTLQIAGTMGYLAPEYATRGQLSEKVDVFSFGVLVLEIVSGRKNIERTLNEDRIYLLEWVWKLHEGNKLLELVDPKVNTRNHEEEILHVIKIGLLCVQSIASKRPSMSRIVAMLQGDMEMEMVIEETQLKSSRLRSLDESLLELSNSSFDNI